MSDKDVKFQVSAEDRFSRVFQNLRRDIAGIGDQASRLQDVAGAASRAVGALSLGTVAGVGGLGLALKSLANDLDALNDASDAVGDSVENLSAVESVARRNGESLDLVVTAATKLNKALADTNPDSPVARALQAIGLSAKELRGVPVTEQLQRIAIALQGYDNNAERVAITTLFFGKATREVASFLNDYAAAGRVSATVTGEQARQAEILNKQLAALSTNAGDAARSVASVLIPALNRYAEVLKFAEKDRGKTFGAELISEVQSARLRVAVSVVEDLTEALRRNPGDTGLQLQLKVARENADALLASATKANAELKALVSVDLTKSTRPANEGGGSLRSRKLPDLTETTNTSTAKISEAQRYLEQLQRQVDQAERLTATQQLLRDIERGRVEGLNPALQKRLLAEARNLDLLREQDKAIKSQQDGLDDLINKSTARSAELDRLLGNTPTGQRQDIERQVDIVLRYSRANPGNEAAQRQALEAVQALRKQFDALDKDIQDVAKGVETPFTRVDQFARNTTDALVELAATGKFSAKSLFDSFKRDLLREFIEEPVRDTMRSVVKGIRDELGKLNGGDNPVSALLRLLGLGKSNTPSGGFPPIVTGGPGFLFGLGGGYTGRAGGGSVNAGDLVRWQENGREWFVPDRDGTVVTERQMQGRGASYSPNYNITINGGDPRETARQVRAMLDERDARLVRSMRNGRLSAL